MTPGALISSPANEAESAALANYSKNLGVLRVTQPALTAAPGRPDGEWEWVFGRDGTLTGRLGTGRWLADCSLPSRAATAIFASIEISGTTGCLLAPVHVAQVRRVLDVIRPEQALVVVSPDASFLLTALHCCDLSREIEGNRLFFAAGEDWQNQLLAVLRDFPGLPTPATFLRPPTTPDEVSRPLIEAAQQTFKQINELKGAELATLTSRPQAPRPSGKRLCVVALSSFRLWADAGAVLAETLQNAVDVVRLDPDRPTMAASLALAQAAAGCDAVITANFTRADAGPCVPTDLPWLAWLTRPAVPRYELAGPHDRLVLADPAWVTRATAAGWPASYVAVGTWPAVTLPDPGDGAAAAIIADTAPPRAGMDEDAFDLSSHLVLWEYIADELRSDPLAVGPSAQVYLETRMTRFGIARDGFNWSLFIDGLIRPAHEQGLARLLIRHGVPIRLYGRGWTDIAEFMPYAGGVVISRESLHAAAAAARVLVLPTHVEQAHPIDALPRPVINASCLTGQELIRRVKGALVARSEGRPRPHIPLSADLILHLLA